MSTTEIEPEQTSPIAVTIPEAAPPTPISEAAAPFDHTNADTILRSSDNVDFRVFRFLLCLASTFFEDMFKLPQADEGNNTNETKNGLPVITVAEDSVILRRMLLFCYPADIPIVENLAEWQSIFAASNKYCIPRAQERCREMLLEPRFLEQNPLQVFAIGCRYGLKMEAMAAAKATIGWQVLNAPPVPELEFVTGLQYQHLMQYSQKCTSEIAKILSGPKFPWVERDYCWHTCEDCSDGWVDIGPDDRDVRKCRWWIAYLKGTKEALEDRSWDKRKRDTLLHKAVGEAGNCPECCENSFADMHRFVNDLEVKILDITTKTPLGFELRECRVVS